MKLDFKIFKYLNIIVVQNILFIFALVACQSTPTFNNFTYKSEQGLKEVKDTILNIDIVDAKSLSYGEFNEEFIDSVYFLQLSSKELIGEIRTLCIFEDRIYVLDQFVAKKVFIFNMKGELLQVIDSHGGGPEEYLLLGEITIDEYKRELIISDEGYPKYLHYSLNGEFLYVTSGVPNSYYYPANQGVFYNCLGYKQMKSESGEYHGLLVCKDTLVLYADFPFSPLQQNAVVSKPFSKNVEGELLYLPSLCDTIYQLFSDSLYKVKYVVKQEKSLWARKDEGLTMEQQDDLIINHKYTFLKGTVFENEEFCVVPVCMGYKRNILIRPYYYNKRNKLVCYFDVDKSFDSSKPLKKGFFNIVNPRCVYKDYFVGTFDPAPIEGKTDLLHPSYRDILEKADENTNPVLVFYKLNSKYE